MHRTRHALIVSVVALAAAGCGQAPPPQFHLNMVTMVKNETSGEYEQEIADVLGGLFGTPDAPRVLAETGLDQNRLDLAAGPAWNDDGGVNHGLYRRHCVHCHGITGDGRGPTALFLDPYPRDYRLGKFKFKSTTLGAKPTTDDLHRVLVNGAPGTSMPSFSLLSEPELESLVEYVKYLAIRGEMETKLADYVYQELGEEEAVDDKGNPVLDEDGNPVMRRIPLDPVHDADQASVIKEDLASIVETWQAADDEIVRPAEDQIPPDNRSPEEIAASIAKGRALFFSEKANCVKCHGPTGLGDGQQTDYDDWAKEQKAFIDATNQLAEKVAAARAKPSDAPDAAAELAADQAQLAVSREVVATLFPLRNAIPRNLRKGVFRGGRRRIDIYHRIYSGIAGTPMPGAAKTTPDGPGLTDEEIWQIVDYVTSLPYEAPSLPQRELPVNLRPVTQ